MIYVDPSELRETSNLLKYISDVIYKPLPSLERLTGADLMISPKGLPPVSTEAILRYHVKKGAKLFQLKFGHDLASSIVDGRLNEAIIRMQKIGAKNWQCVLSFIGTLSMSKDGKFMAVINGQLTYGNVPMKWLQVQSALIAWANKGGTLDALLPSGDLIPFHLALHQKHVDRIKEGGRERLYHSKLPPMYDEDLDHLNPLLREWYVSERLTPVDDIRNILRSIPDSNIGPEKATAILRFMADNSIREDFNGFVSMLDGKKPKLLQVPGIGKKTLDSIKSGLFMTKEEREVGNE